MKAKDLLIGSWQHVRTTYYITQPDSVELCEVDSFELPVHKIYTFKDNGLVVMKYSVITTPNLHYISGGSGDDLAVLIQSSLIDVDYDKYKIEKESLDIIHLCPPARYGIQQKCTMHRIKEDK